MFAAPAIRAALVCAGLVWGHAPVVLAAKTQIDSTTWVDHDAQPIAMPPKWSTKLWGDLTREGLTEPIQRAFDVPDKFLLVAKALGANDEPEAVNVNEFDEVPNSSWFTNRNHIRAVPVAQMRGGAHPMKKPAKPWTVTDAKKGGRTVGFQIKDADGTKWLVKLDPKGYPQIVTGADRIACTIFHAAGYNVPHNEGVRFERGDLTLDQDLLEGKEGEPFGEADLDALLSRGAVFLDGSYSASASEFLPGKVLGPPNSRIKRPGDSNDWYTHLHRRELRGLYVLCSWLNSWDTKDHNFLDAFIESADSTGYVRHYFLDLGACLGAAGPGPKHDWHGYEYWLDYGWIARRLVTLGFVEEPWRVHQETGIPSVGLFTSHEYEPEEFRPLLPHPAFDALTESDGYWGAKIVASFSDAQIAAAIESAEYEDPAASAFLFTTLVERRNKVASHWFNEVAPLDFFHIEKSALRFHDLAVDLGMAKPREYDVEVQTEVGGRKTKDRLRLSGTELALSTFEGEVVNVTLEIRVAGNAAKPTRLELRKTGQQWAVTRVRHG